MRPDTKVFFATALLTLGVATVVYLYVKPPSPGTLAPTPAPIVPPTFSPGSPTPIPATPSPSQNKSTPPPTPTQPPTDPPFYGPTMSPVAGGGWLFHGNPKLQYTTLNTTTTYNQLMSNSIDSVCNYFVPGKNSGGAVNNSLFSYAANGASVYTRCGAGMLMWGNIGATPPPWAFEQATGDAICAAAYGIIYDPRDTSYVVDCYTATPNLYTPDSVASGDILATCRQLYPQSNEGNVIAYCYYDSVTDMCRGVLCAGPHWDRNNSLLSRPVPKPTFQRFVGYASDGVAYMLHKVKLP